MERIRNFKKDGIRRNALRNWGMIFLALGIVGRSVFQNQFLGLGSVTPQQLLEVMSSSDQAMLYATLGIVLQAVETCAIPIFAFLLVEGVKHTSSFKNYFLWVLGLAALSEIPYNLAMSSKFIDLSTRNPVFGLVLVMVLLFFFQTYAEKSGKNTAIKVIVTIAAMIWASMLSIDYGGSLVLVSAVLWIFWDKPLARNISGATVSILCSVSNLFMMAAPMGFLAIHFYNGEKPEDENRTLNYLLYPALLLAAAIGGRFVL